MSKGYIYLFQNKQHKSYVVKIGLTTRYPEIRVKEIYHGASGVPEPFEIVFACSVEDCEYAEKEVHSRLANYRINKKREFFHIPPFVAKEVILDITSVINQKFGVYSPPTIIIDILESDIENNKYNQIEYDKSLNNIVYERPINYFKKSPIGTSILSKDQINRIKLICMIFSTVIPDSEETWKEDFSRDWNPEIDISIWEQIAKAFLKIDQIQYLDNSKKKEAYELILARSMYSTSQVIKKRPSKIFSDREVRRILSNYEFPPQPIIIDLSIP